MKKMRWGIHSVYVLMIVTLLFGLLSMNRLRLSSKEKLTQTEETIHTAVLRSLSRLTEEMAGDLYSIAEADTKKIYVMKLSELQISTGQALLLLSENGRNTPWITFWQSLKTHLDLEIERVIESNTMEPNAKLWLEMADLMTWLSKNPKALMDESTDTLPDELKLPTLQTAYEIDEEKTLRVAERVFGVRGGLRKLENTPPGIRSYVCENGRADVLQSGELLYYNLSLKPKAGDIGEERAEEIFLEFAKKQGLGVELIDLYREEDQIIGKMVPRVSVAQIGRIPDLDRTVEIACTKWSGRICYFSAGKYYTPTSLQTNGLFLPDHKLEEIAAQKGAKVGDPFRYRGRVCRPLIYQRGGYSGRSVLCIDAVSGGQVDLFYVFCPGIGEKKLFYESMEGMLSTSDVNSIGSRRMY